MGGSRGRRAVAVVSVACVALLSACVFDGTWADTPDPVVPVQGAATQFFDVSCVGDDWCMAVGRMSNLPMVQIWDGTSWSVAPAPPVAPSDSNRAQVVSVDCGTPTACVARIDRFMAAPTDFAYVVVWDGDGWLEMPPGLTVDGSFGSLTPSACSADGSCVVVIQERQVTVTWNGSSFATVPYAISAPGWELSGFVCVAIDDCTGLTIDPLVHWNGSTWSEVPGSQLSEAGTYFFGADPDRGFACTAADNCVTAGGNWDLGGAVGLHWDGTTWTADPLPGPGNPTISDLSCAGPSECVGFTTSPIGGVVAWNGSDWYQAPVRPLAVGTLSCVPLTCVAVGANGTFPFTPAAATYTWTNS